jgi:hypothetical protein
MATHETAELSAAAATIADAVSAEGSSGYEGAPGPSTLARAA